MKRYFFLFIMFVSLAIAQANQIDNYVNLVLKEKKIKPSEICDDATFLRRTYLVLTGKIPTKVATENFLRDKSSDKRKRLINELLDSPSFIENQVLKWGDLLRIKSEFPGNLWPNGVQAYQRWITEQVTQNVPYDQFVRNLLLSSGSNFRQPAVNFYRAFQKRKPEAISENVALLFLGNRKNISGSEIFFSQIKYKNSQEWKEEIVYIDIDVEPNAENVQMPDGKELDPTQNKDYRKVYVDWLTSSGNTRFAQTIANRVWYWVMKRGIVHEPDDFREDNLPSNPALLDYLSKELVSHKFDLKYLYKIILTSETFQRSSHTNESNKEDVNYFSHYLVDRITAEQLVDAIGDITGIRDAYMSKTPEPYSYYPCDIEAMQLADGSVTSSQLELFGRPSRDVSFENDRNNEVNAKQILFLLNSSSLMEKIEKSKNISQLVTSCKDLDEVTNKVYLMVLNRYPSEKEKEKVKRVSLEDKNLRESANRLIWALINTKDFLFVK